MFYNSENMLPVYTNLGKRDNGFYDGFRLKEAFLINGKLNC